MKSNFCSENPIYLQLASKIEDYILMEIWKEGMQIPSINELSMMAKISFSTAGRGVNLLVKDGILYKKRGIGFFVSNGSHQKIAGKRKKAFYEKYVLKLLEEAQMLNITKQEIIFNIEKARRRKTVIK